MVAAAGRGIDRLRELAETPDPDERKAMAGLLAPGISAAWSQGEEPTDEVVGFALRWEPGQLAEYLSRAIRDRNLRVEGW